MPLSRSNEDFAAIENSGGRSYLIGIGVFWRSMFFEWERLAEDSVLVFRQLLGALASKPA